MKRKIVQIAVAEGVDHDGQPETTLYALDSEGTVWCRDFRGRQWVELDPLPERDES